jgi:hypothetical protein
LTAPHLVRTGNGEYLNFNLDTVGQRPFGAMILVYLRQREFLKAKAAVSELCCSE